MDRNADRNAILRNEIVHDPSPGHSPWGGTAIRVQDNPLAITHWVVAGRLLLASRGNAEDNEVRGNVIRGAEMAIYNATGSHGSRITENLIENCLQGIALPGFTSELGKQVAGSCSGNERPCNFDEDCFIEGYDDAPNGTCDQPEPPWCWMSGRPCYDARDCEGDEFEVCGVFEPTDDIRVVRPLVQDNVVKGPWVGGDEDGSWGIGAFYTLKAEIRRNHVQDNAVGFIAGENSLTDAVIEHNSVVHSHLALLLFDFGYAGTFGASIRLNDFVDYKRSYEAWFELDGELSRMRQGNHWGVTCEEGVLGFPADPNFPAATDSFAFGEPVAELSGAELAQLTPCSLAAE
jgi:hypothetical protein